jgi:hypothetical protein
VYKNTNLKYRLVFDFHGKLSNPTRNRNLPKTQCSILPSLSLRAIPSATSKELCRRDLFARSNLSLLLVPWEAAIEKTDSSLIRPFIVLFHPAAHWLDSGWV